MKTPVVKPDTKAAMPVKAAKPAKSEVPSVLKKAASTGAATAQAPAKAGKVAKSGMPAPVSSKKKPAPAPAAPAVPVPKSRPVAKIDSPEKPASATPQLSPLGVPVRSGRPSSRLVQLTVPSMAQSIASTAAKASFTQMTATQPIVSPLASAIKKDASLAGNWKSKPVEQLTDEEVIAMSDEDYMNATQMAFFRLKLIKLKNDMLSNAGETTEHLREDTVVVPDPADRATIEEEHALELRTRDRERKLLKKIEQSINRIDAGDYGYCDETGEAIGVGRLIARPTATLSLEAQQRRELKQKMFGD
ncbi:RNA polymerase-binding transcription factor DksA [mine drainage metagenome]|uniref:RNA polymerase-binding transcription factor DksA n=1 Tax=mine drainage metagenome TaxID=410659 RepID=A0A1J5PUS3_9ZZZZ